MPSASEPFAGYTPLRYTPIPDQLFDEQLPDLSGAELKVLLYIFRHTFGWKKHHDDISLSQMVKGIIKKDGSRLDRGAGLSESSILRALASLEKRGLILARRNYSAERGNLTTTYTVPIQGETPPPSHDSEGSIPPEAGPGRPPKSRTQETRKQENSNGQDGSRHVDRPRLTVDQEDAEMIALYVDDWRRELGDKSGQLRAKAQVVALYARSGVTFEQFVAEMQAARAAAKAKVGAENRWAYWYTVLEDRLGK